MNSQTGDGPPRPVLIAALVVAVGAVVAVLVVAAVLQRPAGQAPVAITSVPAPRAGSPECRALIEALPGQLGDYRRAAVVEPAPAGTAAWQTEGDGEPLILRCGLDRPLEFVMGSPIQVVDAVQWFRVGEAGVGDDRVGEAGVGDDRVGDEADGRATWFAVDRPVYVALTLPPESGSTPIQALSATIAAALPETAVDPAPVG
ncbi:DUF3515 domain-containing protein [Mycolicibacterium pyrenivorans]|uniref:DUF3515 domain-containing protein n=1 Tax=Mycolicibacterium pyrenivorans TaxID=187102 RepID=UPI0021F2ED3F|nr:DUF3515 domain-containing protein [Mycolicibacterium pyrenivorans]MCV7154253.1 DUF3515 domain-containing protein [Mycolicibacterium pyrenivorans]